MPDADADAQFYCFENQIMHRGMHRLRAEADFGLVPDADVDALFYLKHQNYA